jgi:hypothetical protein
MARKRKVGRPKGTGGKRKSDAAKIADIVRKRWAEGLSCYGRGHNTVVNQAIRRGVEDNAALQIKIAQARRTVRDELGYDPEEQLKAA